MINAAIQSRAPEELTFAICSIPCFPLLAPRPCTHAPRSAQLRLPGHSADRKTWCVVISEARRKLSWGPQRRKCVGDQRDLWQTSTADRNKLLVTVMPIQYYSMMYAILRSLSVRCKRHVQGVTAQAEAKSL